MYIPMINEKVGDLVNWASVGHLNFDGDAVQDFIDNIA